MSKIRVYELAKQIEKDSSEIVSKLKEFGVDVKNHMSSITDEDATKVKDAFKGASKKKEEVKEIVKKAAKDIKDTVSENNKPNNHVKSEGQPKNDGQKSDKAEQANANKPAENAGEKKEKHITKVYNPQNSAQGQGRNNNYRGNNNNNNNNNNNDSIKIDANNDDSNSINIVKD